MKKEVTLFLAITWLGVSDGADTELQLYRPFTETSKHLPFNIVEKKRGQCFEQSKLIKREDAWHCTADGKHYDPCFVKPFGSRNTAVCPLSVWANQSVEITVSQSLDNSRHLPLDMSKAFPWAIELVTGEQCHSVVSTEVHDGLPVRYHCNNHSVLVGHIQRCESVWHMLQHKPQGISLTDIAKAWF